MTWKMIKIIVCCCFLNYLTIFIYLNDWEINWILKSWNITPFVVKLYYDKEMSVFTNILEYLLQWNLHNPTPE